MKTGHQRRVRARAERADAAKKARMNRRLRRVGWRTAGFLTVAMLYLVETRPAGLFSLGRLSWVASFLCSFAVLLQICDFWPRRRFGPLVLAAGLALAGALMVFHTLEDSQAPDPFLGPTFAVVGKEYRPMTWHFISTSTYRRVPHLLFYSCMSSLQRTPARLRRQLPLSAYTFTPIFWPSNCTMPSAL
ncbi:MAG TPA: hypothetical protein VEF89_28680 [Solirubrobacteraceae bacterium]|nr:hypothetical protein [Solirubrobacteraceae bacterium]